MAFKHKTNTRSKHNFWDNSSSPSSVGSARGTHSAPQCWTWSVMSCSSPQKQTHEGCDHPLEMPRWAWGEPGASGDEGSKKRRAAVPGLGKDLPIPLFSTPERPQQTQSREFIASPTCCPYKNRSRSKQAQKPALREQQAHPMPSVP